MKSAISRIYTRVMFPHHSIMFTVKLTNHVKNIYMIFFHAGFQAARSYYSQYEKSQNFIFLDPFTIHSYHRIKLTNIFPLVSENLKFCFSNGQRVFVISSFYNFQAKPGLLNEETARLDRIYRCGTQECETPHFLNTLVGDTWATSR